MFSRDRLKSLFTKDRFKRYLHNATSRYRLGEYLKEQADGGKVKLVFGGHWSDHPGWFVLTEKDQDITQRLRLPDDCADAIFTEHVIEHLYLADTVRFMRETRRVLKEDGVVRIVCPGFERVLANDLSHDSDKHYIGGFIAPYVFAEEDRILRELQLDGVFAAPRVFFFNSIFNRHGHRFIWSAELLVKVLAALHFRDVSVREIGEGVHSEYCIERRRRGLYLGGDWEADRTETTIYDPESMVVEAIK